MSDARLTIGELARRTQVAPSALRYYEELGLLSAEARIAGQRRYSPAAVDQVGVILFLRDVGFSLAQMKALMATRSESPDGWRELVRRKLDELEDQARKVEVARVALEHSLRCRHSELDDCPNFWKVVGARLAGVPLEAVHDH